MPGPSPVVVPLSAPVRTPVASAAINGDEHHELAIVDRFAGPGDLDRICDALAEATEISIDLETTHLTPWSAPIAAARSAKIGAGQTINQYQHETGCSIDGRPRARIVAIDEPADGQMAKSLIAQVNADRCGENAVDSYRPDHEVILDALLALPVDLDGVGGRGGDPLVSVIAEALRHGMGERGRGGQGDKWGMALRNRGMSARLDDSGQAWLFIAKGHPVFAEFARGMSFADVFPILRRTPGAIEAGQRGGVDSRVKIDARKGGYAGVWIPVPVDMEPEPATEPDPDDPLA